MLFNRLLAAAGSLVFLATAATASTVTVDVSGASNPYLSAGTWIRYDNDSVPRYDRAPAQSPVLLSGIDITGGTELTFSASGRASFGVPRDSGPDGQESRTVDGWLGLSGISAPMNSLVGVFLSDRQPLRRHEPDSLVFSSPESRDFESLSPELHQLFFIGDGQTSGGVAQTFVAPESASRLFLGTMDTWGWFNNTGSFSVTVSEVLPEPAPAPVPLPAGLPMLLGAFGLLALRRKR